MRGKQLAAAAAAQHLDYPRRLHELCKENLLTNDAQCPATGSYHVQPRVMQQHGRQRALLRHLCSTGHQIFHILQILPLSLAATSIVPQHRESLRHNV